MTDPDAHIPREGSLLDEEILREPPKRERLTVRLEGRLRRGVSNAWARPALRRALTITLGVVLGASALTVFLALRPIPQPDYETGDMDDLFNYTLLTDEFNNLSVDERLALLAELRKRLGSMDSGQSVLLAAFAARIKGEMREQLMENVSRLGVDIVDEYAIDYNPAASPEDRREFLLHSFVDLHKKMDKLEGRERDMTDEQRLQEGFDQAQRDLETLENAQITGKQAGQLYGALYSTFGANASPQEQARTALFMRDMSRVLRSGGRAP
ncbi:MAG: hypothetical protein R3B57_05650 [Phycisphaerales bacterium]